MPATLVSSLPCTPVVASETVVVLGDWTPSDVTRCRECFGWGFAWVQYAGAEPMPGLDCADCGGTGAAR